MRILKTLVTVAAISAVSTSAFAGGLSPEIIEAPVMEDTMAAAPSINSGYIVVGVLALLLVGASLGSDEETEPRKRIENCIDCEIRPILVDPSAGGR